MLTYPDGVQVGFAPNALGEATQVGSLATGVSYFPNGAVAGYTLGNGINHSASQNTRGLTSLNADAGILQDAYGYDANGNIASIADQLSGTASRTLGYDGLDRLTAANSPGVWGSASYAYDALDNLRTSVVGARSTVHGYDASNRLATLAINGAYTGFAYDAQGNVTGRGAQGFYFDEGNRLQLANGVASYVYDGLGRRVAATDQYGLHASVYDSRGQLLYTTTQVNGTAQATRLVYLAGKLIAEQGSAGTSYVSTDALGSPVARTDAGAQVQSVTRYEPYGGVAAGANLADVGFTGHVNEPLTGLVYMQQRYYDPVAGRFLSVDPVVTDANTGLGFNVYEYAKSNPYKYTDPDGRAETIIDETHVSRGGLEAEIGGGWAGPPSRATRSVADARANLTEARAQAAAKESAKGAESNKGTTGGERAGKAFTPAGKAEVESENAEKNNGQTTCSNCGQQTVPAKQSQAGVTPPANETHVDHITPKSKGGDGSPSNGQVLCRECNLTKSNK